MVSFVVAAAEAATAAAAAAAAVPPCAAAARRRRGGGAERRSERPTRSEAAVSGAPRPMASAASRHEKRMLQRPACSLSVVARPLRPAFLRLLTGAEMRLTLCVPQRSRTNARAVVNDLAAQVAALPSDDLIRGSCPLGIFVPHGTGVPDSSSSLLPEEASARAAHRWFSVRHYEGRRHVDHDCGAARARDARGRTRSGSHRTQRAARRGRHAPHH